MRVFLCFCASRLAPGAKFRKAKFRSHYNKKDQKAYWRTRRNGAGNKTRPHYSTRQKGEAEAFLTWLRSRRSYSNNTLYHYIIFLRQAALELARQGKALHEITLKDCVTLAAIGRDRTMNITLKLWLKYLIETAETEKEAEHYMQKSGCPNQIGSCPKC